MVVPEVIEGRLKFKIFEPDAVVLVYDPPAHVKRKVNGLQLFVFTVKVFSQTLALPVFSVDGTVAKTTSGHLCEKLKFDFAWFV